MFWLKIEKLIIWVYDKVMGFEFLKKQSKEDQCSDDVEKPWWEQVEKQLREDEANPKELPIGKLNNLRLTEAENLTLEEVDDIIDKLNKYYAPFWKPADWHLLSRSEEVPKPHNSEEALALLRRLRPELQKLFMRYVDDELLFEKFVAKKKEADKQNPQKMFTRLDQHSKEFYRSKGINVDNPTTKDIEKYQERVEYTLPLISHELERRTAQDLPDYSNQERSDINHLLWDINDFWSEFDENGHLIKRLRGKTWVQKLRELKAAFIDR